MGIDLEAAKALLNERKESGKSISEGSSFKWFRIPSTGEVKIRFLPPYPGQGLPGKIVYKHYGIPEIGGMTCAKTWKMECPICKMVDNLKYKVDSLIDQFVAVPRAYHEILVIDGIDPDSGQKYDPREPVIMGSSEYTFYWLIEQFTNTDVGDISDPRTGANVVFRRKKQNGPLDRIIARGSSAIAGSEEEIQSILSKMTDLNTIWKTPDNEYLAKLNIAAGAIKTYCLERVETLNEVTGEGKKVESLSEKKEAPKEEVKAAPKEKSSPAPVANGQESKPCFGKYNEQTDEYKNTECALCYLELECSPDM